MNQQFQELDTAGSIFAYCFVFVCSLFLTVGKSRGKDLSNIPGMCSDDGEEEVETAPVSEGLCLNMLTYLIDGS